MAQDPQLASRVELVRTDGSLDELGSETFDLVLSKDSFEHYVEPESFVFTISRFLKPSALLAIGCGPLWRSPTGGHIEFMTPMPWAHLVFPEDVIMRERRRFRPAEDARSFEEIRGGLNRMTLGRFKAIMRSTALECVFFDTNVGENPVVRAMNVVAAVPPLRELFTTNVYGIWRKSAAATADAPTATRRAGLPPSLPAPSSPSRRERLEAAAGDLEGSLLSTGRRRVCTSSADRHRPQRRRALAALC